MLLSNTARSRSSGFSMIEILVALAVMAILGVLLMVGSQSVRNKSDKAVTLSNWRQISVAIFSYCNDHQQRIPGPLNSLQRAFYNAGQAPGYPPGEIGYFLAPYLAPGLPGQGQKAKTDYTLPPMQSPAVRRQSPLGDKAVQFHMNITIYTHGDERISPFGYRSSGIPPMSLIAVTRTFQEFQANLSEHPMFFMIDRDAIGWDAATLEPLGFTAKPLFGNSRLALYFDGHAADYYPGVKNYPTTGRNGRALSDR